MSSGFFLLAVALIVGSFSSVSLADRSDDLRRCHRIRNTFTLNQTNVNTLVGLACSGLSHVENERRSMDYDDSLTTFHQYESQGSGSQVTVTGYCAIPWSKLRESKIENLDKYKINLTISRVQANQPEVKIKGKLSGRSFGLEFSANEFFDDRCGSEEMSVKRLSQVNLGLGFGFEDLKDMLVAGRSGASLHLLQNENWAQGQSNVHFSGVGVEYRMAQFNGRQLALVATTGNTSGSLFVRSANYLEYAEGSSYFELRKDSFGTAVGFAHGASSWNRHPDFGTNHKFQSYSIPGGAKILGCSAIVYDGELSRPADLNLENCIQRINKSALKALQTPSVSLTLSAPFVARTSGSTLTKAEPKPVRKVVDFRQLDQKLSDYLSKTYGPVKNYSIKPGVFEQGKVSWTKEDRERGFVVVDRRISFSEDKTAVGVIEARYNITGKPSQNAYTVQVSDLH
jgi:hypothetical protein